MHETEQGMRIVEKGELTVQIEADPAAYVLTLYGELDLACAEVLEGEIRRAEGEQPSSLIIDLSGVDYIDSIGMAVLAHAADRSRLNGNRLGLLRPVGSAERLLAIAGLDGELPFLD